MKRLLRWILFQFWKLQFKKVIIDFKIVGYHCRECVGKDSMKCGEFPCPCKPNEKLISRFVNVKYNNLLNKWNTSVL
jgi:hypothetical protein